jgi:hypothetical protein
LDIRRQCLEKEIDFFFKQTGAKFLKDGKLYRIARKDQHRMARKAGINVHIRKKNDKKSNNRIEEQISIFE